ncbi:MAG: hypothetical protein WC528_00515 [Patescibacteria group bacterium]
MSISVKMATEALGGPAARSKKVKAYLTALKRGGLELRLADHPYSLDIHFKKERLGNMHIDPDGKLCFESHLVV